MEISSFYDTLLIMTSIISLIFQCYAVFVVLRASPISMRPYRYFLCLMTVWDLIFTFLIGLGLAPRKISPVSGTYVHGFAQGFGHDFARIMLCMVVFSAVQIMASELNCLLYRLTVMLPNKKVQTLFVRPISKILVQLVFVCIGLFFSIPTYNIFLNQEQLVPFLAYWKIHAAQDLHIDIVVPEDTVILAHDSSFFGPAKVVFVSICLTEIVCFIIAFVIVRMLRCNAHIFSKKTYKIHLQLTILLVVQLISPILFIAIPVCSSLLYSLFDQPIPTVIGDILMLALSFNATANSLLTICFVTPYRRYTKSLLQRIFCLSKKPIQPVERIYIARIFVLMNVYSCSYSCLLQ
ncbi:serpentine type 7TM GPCR chemoreceptor srh domain-containing protein [Ditylenchus destructor]|uniref:Serpentine type 7TM GPCR chemoreceptor srh domain-containing protein n=1 Tax=Ditylenchus destructor TaxID=166010 RepID=A0AAD4R270_9BILA|nr:serpentine type 7TM GPCR chemoreceptor srh domain-containing protein [Ditylenchus destructor]